MKILILTLIAFITSNLSAQNGFNNFECLNANPEAYEIFISGGGEFSDEVNQALNDFCDSLDNAIIPNNDGDDPWNSDGVFIICNGEYIEVDTLNFDPVAFESYVLSLGCTEYQYWDFEDDSIYDDNYGFSNWDCLNYNPDAYEAYVSGGGIFTEELNQTLNEICSDWYGCVGCENDESDPWNSDEVFFICNGEEVVIDTLDLINNPEEFYAYVESLNCAESEDWFNEDNDEEDNDIDEEYYFSWDCIYNYPEAAALYGDYGNPEAGAQLEEFCLAVANGEWMWGEDPSEWPITCDEGTSFATVEFETSGIGYEEEISWSLDGYEGGIGLTPLCLNEGCTQFNMYDSWGDGWGGITFTLNTPNGVLLNGTLEDGFVGALGFGINTTEDCSEVSEVENPFGYDLESFEDVFPSIGEINLDSLYPSIEFSENDLLFIIDGSEVDLSLFDENGLNIYPQEVNGYLIFGPFDINDVLTIDINDIADLLISWGFFRPMNDEIISQGTFSKDDPNLPSILSLSSESSMSIDETKSLEYNSEYLYSTDILGKRVPADRRGIIIFDKYSTGKVVKRFVK